MKILHVLDHSIPLHSGYTFRTRAILREQRRRGWQTCHLTSTKQGEVTAGEETVDGLNFYRTAERSEWLHRLPVLNQYAVIRDLRRRLRNVVDVESPDIVHAHSPCLTGLAALPVCREFDLPLVYEMRASWEDAAVSHGTTTEGSPRYRVTRALETHLLRRAGAVTTICEGLRKDIAARSIDPGKITVVPNAVEAQKFSFRQPPDEDLLTRLGLHGKTVVGFIGSFYSYEGLHLLIEAMTALRRTLPDLHVLLVGGGPEDDSLHAQVAAGGLQSAVTFTGRVPHAEVPRYYSIVDVLAYPRLPIRLTEIVTPLKPLEAMAMGKVLVASDIGGHRELISDNKTGYLFAAGDAGALADAIAAALKNRAAWPQVLDTARRFVESERTWERSVRNYAPVYRGLLELSAN